MTSENDLCNTFIKHVKELGFNCYSEYQNWDIVIERNGVIIGVEAKLTKNLHLLKQLTEKNDTHFKVALLPLSFNQTSSEKDWIFLARKLKILPVMVVDPAKNKPGTYSKPIKIYWEVKNLFYYRHRPKYLLKLPDFNYDVSAGIPSPIKVNSKNIAFVKLEHYALEHGGSITLDDAKSFGFARVSKFFYDYNWNTGRWDLNKNNMASKVYPHIEAGLRGNKNQ